MSLTRLGAIVIEAKRQRRINPRAEVRVVLGTDILRAIVRRTAHMRDIPAVEELHSRFRIAGCVIEANDDNPAGVSYRVVPEGVWP